MTTVAVALVAAVRDGAPVDVGELLTSAGVDPFDALGGVLAVAAVLAAGPEAGAVLAQVGLRAALAGHGDTRAGGGGPDAP